MSFVTSVLTYRNQSPSHKAGIKRGMDGLCKFINTFHRNPLSTICFKLTMWLLFNFAMIYIYTIGMNLFAVTNWSEYLYPIKLTNLLRLYLLIFVGIPLITLISIIAVTIRNVVVMFRYKYWCGYCNALKPGGYQLWRDLGWFKYECHVAAEKKYKQDVCNICLESLTELLGNNIEVKIIACGHIFCESCFKQYQKINSNCPPLHCPCCRRKIYKTSYCTYDKNLDKGYWSKWYFYGFKNKFWFWISTNLSK